MTDTDSTTGPVVVYAGDSDATISLFDMVDPLVDAVFRHRGLTSKRRYLNILRMRYKKMLEDTGVSDTDELRGLVRRLSLRAVNEYVEQALQPGYRMLPDVHHVDPAS